MADDNEVARGILRDIVKTHANWEIVGEAVDGKDAIQKASELKPDLVLMDLAMPNMDGITAAREIRKLLPDAPILLVSLHNIPHVEMMAKSAGVQKFVAKMDADSTLIPAIEEALRERAVAAAASAGQSDGTGAGATAPAAAVAMEKLAEEITKAQQSGPPTPDKPAGSDAANGEAGKTNGDPQAN